ncbi:MAG: hypothetical protein RL154_454 [Pseudomonadota bacterium]
MPIVVEFLIICAVCVIIFEGIYGFIALFFRNRPNIFRFIIRIFCMFITAFLLFAHFALPTIAYNYLGAKEVLARLSPTWLLSDQPDIVRLEKKDKWIMFASQSDLFTKMLFSNIIHFPNLAYNYFTERKSVVDINKSFFGISIDPVKTDKKIILLKLKELGAKSILMRINYKKELFASDEYEKTREMAQLLKKNGYEVLIVCAQNRDIFTDNIDLRGYFETLFTDFGAYASEFQIGETINRPKWGVIRLGDYENYFEAAKNARDKIAPNAKLIAPSVIDFEWLYTVYYANAIKDFDILNSLLYVDRVGYPENAQMGADTVDKIRLMSAVTHQKPFYITEFNWPLSGAGEYKPTSDQEAVNELLHAAYSVRYAFLALGSNQTNKIYYWQLFANGYGLIDHLTLSEKPAFKAYQSVIRFFGNAKNIKLSKINEKCYNLKSENNTQATWCIEDTGTKLITQKDTKYYDMFGAEVINPTLGISPIYAVK